MNDNQQLLSEAVERDLRKVLAEDSNCIQSPECLKHSIMKARFVKHYAEKIAQAYPNYHANTCEWFASVAFDDAVDAIYGIPA